MDSIPYKKAQVKRMDTKTGSNILLFTRNTPQPPRQTLPQSKGLGKGFPIKWTKETSRCGYTNI